MVNSSVDSNTGTGAGSNRNPGNLDDRDCGDAVRATCPKSPLYLTDYKDGAIITTDINKLKKSNNHSHHNHHHHSKGKTATTGTANSQPSQITIHNL